MTGGGIVPQGFRGGGQGGPSGPVTYDDKGAEAWRLKHTGEDTLDHPPAGYIPIKREGLGSRVLRRIKSFGSSESKG